MCFLEIFNRMIWLEGVEPFDNDETVITSGTILNVVRNKKNPQKHKILNFIMVT